MRTSRAAAAIVATATLALVAAAALVPPPDYSSTFFVDAAWHDHHGHVRILYHDMANATQSVRLEVLGLEETFQKTHYSSQFSEDVHLGGVPANGWRAHPVTFDVVHGELGRLSIKTEIHAEGDPRPPVIYGPAR